MKQRYWCDKEVMVIGSAMQAVMNRVGLERQERIPESMQGDVRRIAGSVMEAHCAVYKNQENKGQYFLHEHDVRMQGESRKTLNELEN